MINLKSINNNFYLIEDIFHKTMKSLKGKLYYNEFFKIFKKLCEFKNFECIDMNGYPLIIINKNYYLICDEYINCELVEEEYFFESFAIFQIRKISRNIITSTKEIYDFIDNIKEELKHNFYENIRLEDFIYCESLNKYFILSAKNNIKYEGDVHFKIYVSNLFLNKSPYLYNGHEVNSIKDLEMLL